MSKKFTVTFEVRGTIEVVVDSDYEVGAISKAMRMKQNSGDVVIKQMYNAEAEEL